MFCHPELVGEFLISNTDAIKFTSHTISVLTFIIFVNNTAKNIYLNISHEKFSPPPPHHFPHRL